MNAIEMAMEIGSPLCLLLLFLFSLFINLTMSAAFATTTDTYVRADFPADFIFGSGSAAYQVEGAAFEDGRTPSIWDSFAHTPGRLNGANGDKSCDQYHKYKEDVQLMANMGLDAYRFSISWSRLIPGGRGAVNAKGLQYYNNLIDELINHGIQPHVTLYHNDMPQSLEDEYGGLLSRNVVRDFTAYADVCFREFGDRVLHWTTFNEANILPLGAYIVGNVPPGHCNTPNRTDCIQGKSSLDPYTVGHNILLSHASVSALYKEKYKGIQQGILGINVYIYWFIPETDSINDVKATQRANEFLISWFLDPLFFGYYPEIMNRAANGKMPIFTQDESNQVKDSLDFVGLNQYTIVYVADNEIDDPYGVGILLKGAAFDNPLEQLPVRPEALYGVLEYLKQVYGNPPIYIHENGQQMERNGTLNDIARVEYISAYIGSLLHAIRNGSNTKGYFVWSFLDSFELLGGYLSGYGLYYVDLDDDDLKRYPKTSASWYTDFLKNGRRCDLQNGSMQVEKTLSASSSFRSSS